jgi:hypothetical protein
MFGDPVVVAESTATPPSVARGTLWSGARQSPVAEGGTDMQALEGARRPHQRRLIVLAALAVALLLAGVVARPSAAWAGGVGKWTNLSGATGSDLTQVGLVARQRAS